MSRIYRQAMMQPLYGFFHYLALVIYDVFFRG